MHALWCQRRRKKCKRYGLAAAAPTLEHMHVVLLPLKSFLAGVACQPKMPSAFKNRCKRKRGRALQAKPKGERIEEIRYVRAASIAK